MSPRGQFLPSFTFHFILPQLKEEPKKIYLVITFILLVNTIILKLGGEAHNILLFPTLFPQLDNYRKWPLFLSHWSGNYFNNYAGLFSCNSSNMMLRQYHGRNLWSAVQVNLFIINNHNITNRHLAYRLFNVQLERTFLETSVCKPYGHARMSVCPQEFESRAWLEGGVPWREPKPGAGRGRRVIRAVRAGGRPRKPRSSKADELRTLG